ncbi:hypothetical protein M9H77_07159 [Catharanthus roseus]|uniref:Uncharacterized protein n=1 Tax=Catharanthus roseus TaxID=4058 RepID=A0ACC0BUC1_CATRO|nr:hypothetical protein M9H77_07159 [Catharanthus roseus]
MEKSNPTLTVALPYRRRYKILNRGCSSKEVILGSCAIQSTIKRGSTSKLYQIKLQIKRLFIKGSHLWELCNPIYNQKRIYIKVVSNQTPNKGIKNKWITIGLIHHGKGWKRRANKRVINLSLQEMCITSIMVVAMDSMLMVETTMEMETSPLEDMLELNFEDSSKDEDGKLEVLLKDSENQMETNLKLFKSGVQREM